MLTFHAASAMPPLIFELLRHLDIYWVTITRQAIAAELASLMRRYAIYHIDVTAYAAMPPLITIYSRRHYAITLWYAAARRCRHFRRQIIFFRLLFSPLLRCFHDIFAFSLRRLRRYLPPSYSISSFFITCLMNIYCQHYTPRLAPQPLRLRRHWLAMTLRHRCRHAEMPRLYWRYAIAWYAIDVIGAGFLRYAMMRLCHGHADAITLMSAIFHIIIVVAITPLMIAAATCRHYWYCRHYCHYADDGHCFADAIIAAYYADEYALIYADYIAINISH